MSVNVENQEKPVIAEEVAGNVTPEATTMKAAPVLPTINFNFLAAAKELPTQQFSRKRIYVAGSVSAPERFEMVKKAFEGIDAEILYPVAQPDEPVILLYKKAIERIKQADEVFILIKEDGTIGENTLWEKAIALAEHKTVYELTF